MNDNIVVPTEQAPGRPAPARVVRYTKATLVTRVALLLLVALVVGFVLGRAYQAAAAPQEGQQLSWLLYDGTVMPSLDEDPNCFLYGNPCPLEKPTQPRQAPGCKLVSTNPNGSHNWDCRSTG